jgi:threonine aldolase
VIDQDEALRICSSARERRITTFLDGARLWNAAVASGATVAQLAAPFDVVSVALSKGLGAPAGTMLAGPRDVMRDCVRHRRMLGGAMRQIGVLGAAGLYALDHHLSRLPRIIRTRSSLPRACAATATYRSLPIRWKRTS